MYKVTCVTDGVEYILHSALSQEHKLIDPKLTTEVNHSGTLEFQMPFNHPNINNLRQMQSEIFVYESGDTDPLWVGRMLTSEEDMYKTGMVTCEGILGYLLDSQIGAYLNQAGVRSFLSLLISNHNTRTDTWKNFILGDVTVEDDNDYIYREQEEGNYSSTLDTINDKLIDKLGGFLKIRYESGSRYMDYVSTAPAARQTIRFGENLIDFVRNVPSDTLATAVIPIGAEYEVTTGTGETEETTTKKLNIKNYQQTDYHPSGADYVYLPTAVAKFGYIYKVVEWKEVTQVANLYNKALAHLQEISDLYAYLEITAADLSVVDDSLWSFRAGESVRIISEPHDVDQTYMIEKIEYDIADPANTKISLGGTTSTYTRSIADRQHKDVLEDEARQNRIRELSDEQKTNKAQIEAEIARVQEEMTDTFTEDLADIEEELEGDIAALQSSIDEQINALQESMAGDLAEVKEELEDDMSTLQSTIEGEITNATDLLSGSDGGYILIDRDANGKPQQIKVLNATTEATATSMIVLNENGFGFRTRASTSEQWGAYQNAWTIDGHLVAQFITAVGTVTAGSIGGWSIGQNTISKQLDSTHSMTISAANGIMFQSGQNIIRVNTTGIAFSNDGGTTWTTGWNVDGTFVAQFITAVGTVTAGSIGGWSIGQNTISKTIDSTHEMAISAANGISFKSGSNVILLSTNGIAFSSDGGSTFTNAWNINGTLSADYVVAGKLTSGTVGGWTIGSTMISNGTAGTNDFASFSTQTGIQLGTTFSVTKAGVLTAQSGTIGGWNIGTDKLYNNGTQGTDLISLSPTAGIQLGDGFSVTKAGVITATSGTIGGWNIGNNELHNNAAASSKISLSTTGITCGNNFSVTAAGELTAKSVTIGDFVLADATDGHYAFKADNTLNSVDYRTWIRTARSGSGHGNETWALSVQTKEHSASEYKGVFIVQSDGQMFVQPASSGVQGSVTLAVDTSSISAMYSSTRYMAVDSSGVTAMYSQSKYLAVGSSGVAVAGGLSTDSMSASGNASVGGNLSVTGTLSAGTFSPSSISTGSITASGNVSVTGTLSAGTFSPSSISTGSISGTGLSITGSGTIGDLTISKPSAGGAKLESTGTIYLSGNALSFSRSNGVKFTVGNSSIGVQALANAGLQTGSALVMTHDGYLAPSASSRRFKKNIRDIQEDVTALYDLCVREFKYKSKYIAETDERADRYIPGFIAEEVDEIMPIAAIHNTEGLSQDWDVRVIVPMMLKLIQDQHKEIELLKTKIA